MRKPKNPRAQLDKQIEEIVRRRLSGIPISVMKIGTVFKEVYRQHDADLTAHGACALDDVVIAAYMRHAETPPPLAAHMAADPHCTCNDCMADYERRIG